MKTGRRRFLAALPALPALAWAPWARALSWDGITAREAGQALRDGLAQGARAALAKLGREDGYLGNPQVRIGLPKNFAKAEQVLRMLGQGRKVDDLVLAVNRAAEAAAPKAEPLLVEAVKNLSLDDAKGILKGGDGAATAYFRKATEARLTEQLLPVIQSVTEQSDLARAYDALAAKLMQLAGIKSELSTVQAYVTRKALDGIYKMLAAEEHALRADPTRYAEGVVEKVFGLLR